MPSYHTPGVYVEENPSTRRSVSDAETAVAAFLGYTAMADRDGESLVMRPTTVTSFVEFERWFGGGPPRHDFHLHDSVRLYFENGGAKCHVVSVGDYAASPELGDRTGGLLGGLARIGEEDEPTRIVAPDATLLPGTGLYELQQHALAQCGRLGNRMAICDVRDTGDLDADAGEFRDSIGTANLRYGAAYFPWLKVAPARGVVPPAGRPFLLPPSGAVAGAYARTDAQRGVWKAPANVALRGVAGPSRDITDQEQDVLAVDAETGKSINPIRELRGRETVIWGARTLAGNDTEWRYVSVRRFVNMVEESVGKAIAWAVFEPNDAATWSAVRSTIANYLLAKWRDGALQGATPEQAFHVRVGLGETMTGQDIAAGRMVVEIGLAMIRPAEFIVLQLSQQMAR